MFKQIKIERDNMLLSEKIKYFVHCVISLLILHHEIFSRCRFSASAQVLHPGCVAKCGDIDIPYPFGTTAECYLSPDFMVNCIKMASDPPQLFFRNSDSVVVTNISRDGQLTILIHIGKDCYYRDGSRNTNESQSAMITLGHNFPFSFTQNKFIAIGCDTIARMDTIDATTGCYSRCGNQSLQKIVYDGSCSGLGCCQMTIPANVLKLNVSVSSIDNHIGVWDDNPCSYTFLAANDYFTFSKGDLYNLKNRSKVPAILDWAIGDSSCQNIPKIPGDFVCQNNTECVDSTNGPGYRCKCLKGYHGNPYMPGGCQDVKECASEPCGSDNICTDTDGSYECSCKPGYEGTAKVGGGGCTQIPKLPILQITVGTGVGLAAFLFVGSWVYWVYSKRKHLQLKQKFFEQNGGLMLKKELSTRDGYSDTARIFTAKELEQATSNFDEKKIIGRGGFGTVYKGILEDGRVIAIKKSKVMDQDQIEQFINEVIVLSQINHRNVVRLLGCCLETEVPLLVYEYVSNGTLHEHIHETENHPTGVLSWETRLKIAAEIAGVLAYLHSEASVPIVHRDIKCTNILLDENYTAKVSDFGASRLVPVDQDTLSTMVQGTIGYLDPEYLHTSQLTDKSDVYSFGVVLAELMTGKKALAFDRPEEERCLAMMFILSMKNGKLLSVIEDGLANDGNRKQIEEAANLALACLRVIGDERPSMREVASELQRLVLMGKHHWTEAAKGSEQNEHLLACQQLLDGYDPSCSTTGFYNSVTDDFVLSVGDGR